MEKTKVCCISQPQKLRKSWWSRFCVSLGWGSRCVFLHEVSCFRLCLWWVCAESSCATFRGQVPQSFGMGTNYWSLCRLSGEKHPLACFQVANFVKRVSAMVVKLKMCNSLQLEVIFANIWLGLVLKVVSGGVASNKVVRSKLNNLVEAVGLRLVCPPPRLCTDNGVSFYLLSYI